jgi:multidrug/hemolysin transport system permease protein
MITCGVLTLGLIVLSIGGSLYLTFSKVLLLYLNTILGCASATLLMMVIASFFKKSGALGAFGGIVSAAVGFVIGAYVPLGSFSTTVQTTLSFIPGAQVASIYRQLLMGGVLENVANTMGSNGGAEFLKGWSDEFSLSLTMFSYKTTLFFSFMYAVGSILIGLILNVVLYKKATKRS